MTKKDKHGRVKLIANPGAGQLRRSIGVLNEVMRTLMDSGLVVDVALAHPKRYATPIARRAAREGYDTIIAMGGDSTIDAVIEGMAGSDVHLGIIPAGTANDIAASLGIPLDLTAAAELVATDEVRAVDLGLLSTKKRKKYPFLMLTAVGLTASLYPKIKNVPEGDLEGLKEAVSVLFNFKKDPKVYLTLDDESKVEVETMLVTIANTPLIALKNNLAPDASMDDGLLDIAVYPGFSKGELMAYFARTANERVVPDGKIERYRARKIKIKTTPKLDIAAEGMVMGKGTATIKVLPGALKVIAPEPGAGAEKPQSEDAKTLPAPVAVSVSNEDAERQ